MSSPLSDTSAGARLELRVTPKAGRNALGPVQDGRLKVYVTAAPEDGKATAAVIKLLAKRFGLPPSSIELLAGATSRDKSVLLHGAKLEEIQELLLR